MSREIRFRAWNAEFGEMVYASDANQWLYEKREFMPFVFEVGFSHYPEEWQLMQWTGLVDKNGKDIYEGDLMKFAHYLDRTARIGEVVWNDFNLCWSLKTSIVQDLFIYRSNGVEFEVIGNIHQNADLLQ